MPLAIASWRNSATDQRASGRPRRDGSSQASALIATTTLGRKAGWTPAARPVVEARQPMGTEPLAPLAGDLARRAELRRDTVTCILCSDSPIQLAPVR